MMATCTDQELIARYKAGENRAFDALLNRHQQAVFNKIYFMVKDEDVANDVFQDTFIKAVNTIQEGRYNEQGKFLPWIMRIAHNLAIDTFRRSRKMPLVRSTDEYDVFSTISTDEQHIEDRLVEGQIHSDVMKLVDLLPAEQQEVVRLRVESGLSFQEIADETGVSINTALGRMRYALISMRKHIERNGMQLTAL
jgi:RNA polymerase sigma-70 factor (ECF subfamily)